MAADAQLWATPPPGITTPLISTKRRDALIELAFLRAFLAWEAFLEESFILYLMGQRAPRGRAPQRFAFPPTHKAALEWIKPENRPYAEWTHATNVSSRAEKFFKDGRPFASVLRIQQNAFEEARKIRNAISHRSKSVRETFEHLIRDKLKTLPANLTVGGFLNTTVPGSAPPISFMEFYLSRIDFSAKQIVRR